MKCQEARQLLSPYIDLVLTEKEKIRLEMHLANCAECRGELAELRSLVASFKKLEDLEAPAGFMDELRLKLLDDKIVQFPHREPIITKINPKGWVAASVASVALALGIYISSVVPYQMVANIFDKIPQVIFQKQDNGLPENVENLIKEKQNEMQVAQVPGKTVSNPGDKTLAGSNEGNPATPAANSSTTPGKTVVADNTKKTVPGPGVTESRNINTYNLQMKVADVSATVDDLRLLAADRKLAVETSTPSLMTGSTRLVTIRVAPEQADELIARIKEMGYGDPTKGKLDITIDYAKMQDRLQEVQAEIKDLGSKETLTEGEQNKLKVLDFEKSYLEDKLSTMEDNTKLVAINILVTENAQ